MRAKCIVGARFFVMVAERSRSGASAPLSDQGKNSDCTETDPMFWLGKPMRFGIGKHWGTPKKFVI